MVLIRSHTLRLALTLCVLSTVACCARATTQKDDKAATDARLGSELRSGALAIGPQFADAGPFSEGLAAVRALDANDNGKWGYIDKTGRSVIEPRFDAADAFSEGLAAIRLGDERTGKWGFIDLTGKIVIAPRWDHVTEFSRGIAVVRSGNILTGTERLIDKTGNYVTSLDAGVVLPCANGLILVGTNVSWDDAGVHRRFGFTDDAGKYLIDARFDDAFCFTYGVAAVRVGMGQLGKWGFIDITGRFVLEPQWDAAFPFTEGTATVGNNHVNGEQWGVIDRAGQIVLPLRFPEPLLFSDGLAIESQTAFRWATDADGVTTAVSTKSYGFVLKNGVSETGQRWAEVSQFSQGLAAVKIEDFPKDRWGYIDAKGKYFLTPQFDDAKPFSEGLAAVQVSDGEQDKWGYIAR